MNPRIIDSDLTVVGGGIAGLCAALAAARKGLRVALLEARDVLGGNASSENRVHMNGAGNANSSFYAREGGIADEIKLSVFHANPRYNFKDECERSDMALLDLALREKNLSLFLGTAARSVHCDGGHVQSVEAYRCRTEETLLFRSPLFADASGDGFVAFSAGAAFRMGREARSEYDEDLAEEVADDHTMGSSILFTVGKADHPIPFVKPDFAYDYKKDGILPFCQRPETGRSLPKKLDGVDGIWWLSVGGMFDTIHDHDRIDLELKKLVYGFFDYVKNSGDYENTENYYLKWVAATPAKRESRRFLGDYVLSQKDLVNQTPFPDAVSTGGWSLDIHDPGGIYGGGKTSKFGKIHGLYNIPYRILYTRDIDNLFLCGRIVSATHVALGSLRVMQTLGAMAQAVGTAAFLCHRDGCLPRDIGAPHRMAELQSILVRDGQYIAGRQEEVGLAANADIHASSTAVFENTHADVTFPLDRGYALALPLTGDRLDSVELCLRNDTDTEKILTIRLTASYAQDTYETGRELARCSIPLPPHADGYFPAAFGCREIPHHLALLHLDPAPGISFYATRQHITGAPCFFCHDGQISARFLLPEEPKVDQHYAICFRNLLPSMPLYDPRNVCDGFSRPVALPHVWKAPVAEQPYIELIFPDPCDAEEILILFNGQIENDHFSTTVEALTRRYTLTVEDRNGCRDSEFCDNYLAFIRHTGPFPGLKRIRITVQETYGSRYAEIYAVKVF